MKKVFLMTLCLVAAMTAWARPVSVEQASRQARQFLQQRLSAAGRHLAPAQMETELVKSSEYYVFNVGSDEGFVIVSADDCATPILGWCDHGSFDEDDMPENMRSLLELYASELMYMKSMGLQASLPPTAVKEPIGPLLTTHWNQDDPFNRQCPYYLNNPKNKRCMTGCVATSMAQILAYSGNRPSGTTMTIAAYDCTTKLTADSIRIHVDQLPKTTFDWDKMLNDYDDNATDAQRQAVAKLMAYCGAALRSDYGEKSTSAYQSMVVPALRSYFGTDGKRVYRQDYTFAQWNNLIYDELLERRPVICDGRTSDGGHSFVVDGFDGGELFHVNWGWGGHNDGYFLLSVLHPADNSGIGASTSNNGYSYSQSAIIGIKPGVSPINEPVQMTPSNFTVSGNTVSFSIYNYTGETATFDIGVGAIDDHGNISNVITCIKDKSLDYLWGYSNLTATIDGKNLTEGVYHYVVTSKLSESKVWQTEMPYWKEYIEVTVDASHRVTLRMMPPSPVLTVVEGLSWRPGDNFAGQSVDIKTKVKNSGGEFYGPLYLFASQTKDKGEYNTRLGITIAAGATAEATFEFTPAKEGTWNLWLCADSEGQAVMASATMSVKKVSYVKPGYLEVTNLRIFSPMDEDSWAIDGQGNWQVDVLSSSLQLIPTVRNTSDTDLKGENKIYVRLQRKQGSTWKNVTSYKYTITDFAANTGYNLTLKGGVPIDFGDVGYGLYRLAIYLDDAVQDVRYQMNLTGGYPVWATDGTRSLVKTTDGHVGVADNILAVDLSFFGFSSITPNGNPNTLYILGDSQTVPATLGGRNVVQGGTAGDITVSEGYPFFSPVDFTASSISYSRTFSTGLTSEATGWNTITLPFEPTTITVGGQRIDWFHTGDEENRNFFLMEFSGDDDEHAFFDFAARFKPYVPYIIGLPGTDFGAACISGKEIVFRADHAAVPATEAAVRTGNVFKFFGTTTRTAGSQTVYAVNTVGDAFVPTTNSIKPFRSYFVAQDISPNNILINFAHFTSTGISDILRETKKTNGGQRNENYYYDLGGKRVQQPMKRGIYLRNGKKVLHAAGTPGQ